MKIVSKKAGEKEEADLIKRISPIAWRMSIYSINLNFIGNKESQYR
jgi:hypothetical protein